MNRSAKQIFLILSSCIICVHNANAASNLPPLPISDQGPVVTQTTEKKPLNTTQETADSVNIDQFISDVDKKITEKESAESREEGSSRSINSDEVGDNIVEKQNTPPDLTIEQSKATTLPATTEALAPISEEQQEINQITQQKTTAASAINTSPSVNVPEVTSQTGTQESNIKTTGPVNSTSVVSEDVNTNATSPALNNPELLVPAYDSEAPKSKGSTPEVTKNNNQTPTTPDSFVSDELKVSLYFNDDIEVGALTKEAHLDQISFLEYCDIFWQNYYVSQRAETRKVIELFINNYDKNFNQ